jgi:4-carboxymuconolactone decarboxylase
MPTDTPLDRPTLALIRLAAAIAAGAEGTIHAAMAAALEAGTYAAWVEELLLQSILMTGYPRALAAFALWRKVSGAAAPAADADGDYLNLSAWRARGERTCERVYGDNYDKLRRNVRELHPAVDGWMLVEGYGRTIGRPGLDLLRRELCTVAQTAVLRTHRQLHSHLRGAIHSGATPAQVEAVLAEVTPLLSYEERSEVEGLWAVVRAGWTPED